MSTLALFILAVLGWLFLCSAAAFISRFRDAARDIDWRIRTIQAGRGVER